MGPGPGGPQTGDPHRAKTGDPKEAFFPPRFPKEAPEPLGTLFGPRKHHGALKSFRGPRGGKKRGKFTPLSPRPGGATPGAPGGGGWQNPARPSSGPRGKGPPGDPREVEEEGVSLLRHHRDERGGENPLSNGGRRSWGKKLTPPGGLRGAPKGGGGDRGAPGGPKGPLGPGYGKSAGRGGLGDGGGPPLPGGNAPQGLGPRAGGFSPRPRGRCPQKGAPSFKKGPSRGASGAEFSPPRGGRRRKGFSGKGAAPGGPSTGAPKKGARGRGPRGGRPRGGRGEKRFNRSFAPPTHYPRLWRLDCSGEAGPPQGGIWGRGDAVRLERPGKGAPGGGGSGTP